MIGFLARLVGALPVGRKLLLIYLLDLSAVIYVSGILIHEKYIAIDFARKEVAGNRYIGHIRDALASLPVPLAPDASGPTAETVRQQLVAADAILLRAEAELGDGMDSAEASANLRKVVTEASVRLDSLQFHAVQDASRALITRVGNQSNLILDPDLDSYYTMSLLLLRFPELQEVLARIARLNADFSRKTGTEQAALLTQALLLEGRLDAAVKTLQSDYAEAISAGPPELRQKLGPVVSDLSRALMEFRTETGFRGASAGAIPTQLLAELHARTTRHLLAAWQQTGASLDDLLQRRVTQLLQRMWLHLGTAAGLLLVILGTVYFIARQISRPLHALADVADEVSRSGDYSVRASHDSRDEIGTLVRAFNSMLGQLDRDREQREEVAATERAQQAQRALLESFPTPLIVTSIPDHEVLHANGPAQSWLGGHAHDPWSTALQPPVRAHYFQRMSDEGSVDGFEVQWQTGIDPGGVPIRRWALLSGRRLSYQGRNALLTTFTPIGQIKSLQQRLQLWAKVFEASSESIAIFGFDRQLLTANLAFVKSFGWELGDVVGQAPDFLYSNRHEPAFYEALWQATVIRGSWQGDVWLVRKNGTDYPAWMVANAVRDSAGHITHFVTSCVDMTAHKANEARIQHLAHHDVLTDLPNRSLCMERLTMAIEQAGRHQTLVAVVFIDLDRFKNINDSMGHHVGDALLRSVSKRLLQAVRAGDTVSRLGGDEFVVVLQGSRTRDEIMRVVSERIVTLIRQPHTVEGVELHVSCSAGIAVYPHDGRDIDHLMRHADAAMYHAKAGGRNSAVFFTPEFHAQAQERLAIEIALRQVVQRGELRLFYQPRIAADSGDVLGVEALVRWQHPQWGLVPPDRFIAIAEETGQIAALGDWILEEACRQHADWLASGIGRIPVSVNVSSIQLRDGALPGRLAEILTRHGVVADAIELELTESFLMENAIATVDSLEKLKAIGVCLSIDDFGTGYSSLNYLHQFPIDKLKIDQSFVRDMLDDPADLAITRAIIGLGHTLGLRVVAEGVEHQEEADILRQAGCDELQGYLYARPMPADDLRAWLQGRRVVRAPEPLERPSRRRVPDVGTLAS
ncbi:MAG: EAL domain-containing protein [Rhodoferax sp.]|jgi:diguanylate cyclase (GGDEF)-like protein/PAS domain S-box-containing protein|nr:EAL domain-containing protein [Rhodoferax sp.]